MAIPKLQQLFPAEYILGHNLDHKTRKSDFFFFKLPNYFSHFKLSSFTSTYRILYCLRSSLKLEKWILE